MSTQIPNAIMETVLTRIALLFLTGAAGDLIAARQAAEHMLAAYNAATEEELSLAAQIISLSFHTLEALSYAADPELSLNKILRLRGGAVSLSREQHKAQRKLDKLQRDRKAGIQPQPATSAEPPAAPNEKVDNALHLIEAAREAIEIAHKNGGKNWAQSLQKRMTAKRIADKLKKNQAQHAAHKTAPALAAAHP